MTEHQAMALECVLPVKRMRLFLHGCCVGADAEAAAYVASSAPQVGIIGYPSDIPAMTDADALRLCHMTQPPKNPLARNRDIVAACGVLFACPAEMSEQNRGGTWFTVRTARAAGVPVVLVFPDGRVEGEVP